MRRSSIQLLFLLVVSVMAHARPSVIAHRGASAYLPEHTLPAAAYAHASGADFIEQDVVMSRDDVLVVLHDIHLETTTDVARKFPDRARADGRFYVVDFDWNELAQLSVHERINAASGKRVYPRRFPLQPGAFRLSRFEDQLRLIHGLNQSTGRSVGICPEIKQPAWHAEEGKDLSRALIATLTRHGYMEPEAAVYVQCFEAAELKRLRTEFATDLPLIQLIGLKQWNHANADYAAMLTPAGLAEIATYADGIGPHLAQIMPTVSDDGTAVFTDLVSDAHAAGLIVQPYTFRADDLPPNVPDFASLLTLLTESVQLDGLFTDHVDLVVNHLRSSHP